MPKITVKEKDLSWYYRQRSTGQLIVLMPGVAEFGPYEPTLVDANNFTSVYGNKSVNPKDLSYNMAASFVSSGADVLFWRVDLGAKAASYTYGSGSKVIVSAKYPGSYGNDLKVKALKISEGNYRFIVYNKEGTSVLENLYVNFSDPDSPYYYESVNNDSMCISLKYEGDKPYTDDIDSAIVSLTGGTNGTYTESAVADYLSSDEAKVVFRELSDLLTYDFNIIVSGGYNNYDYRITSKKVTKEDKEVHFESSVATSDSDIFSVLVDGVEAVNNEGYDGPEITIIKEGEVKVTGITVDITDDKSHAVVVKYKSSHELSISQVDDRFIALAEKRGTAIYLVDGDKTWDAEEFHNYVSLPTDITTELTTESSRGFNTSYAAAFGPWVSARYTSTGSSRELPGSYAFIIAWAQSLASGAPVYYAPAGVKRATLNFVNKTMYPVGQAVLDMWQNQDITTTSKGYKINPIMELKQYGYTIYGNSTLLRPMENGATSMLQSFSTRVLANIIKTQAHNISLTLQFDQITDDLFAEFKTLMSTFMDQLKYGGALYDYRIVADRANMTMDELNNKTIPVLIQISPNPAVENFDITLEISQAGVSFSGDDTETAQA